MCRYAQHPYKQHYACFQCRKVFRIPGTDGAFDSPAYTDLLKRKVKCPDCRNPMALMGRDFKAPRESARKQWEKVQQLRNAGIAFEYGSAPVYRPAKLREVAPFIERIEMMKSEGRQLAHRFKKRSTRKAR